MTDLTGLKEDAERACSRIAPTWPLDRFIAVNPFWRLTHKPVAEVAGELAALSGVQLLMRREWYAQEWRAGRLQSEHLREAIVESGSGATEEDLIASFWIRETAPPRRPLVVDVMDSLVRREHELTWREFVMERISRFCASYFDDGQAQINGVREGGLYASWLPQAKSDQMPNLFMALDRYRQTVARLPATADEMIAQGCSDLGVPVNQRESFLAALLLDVNGWASWCAYLRWTAQQGSGDDAHIYELLAIRLAWEWILFVSSDDAIRAEWRFAMTSWKAIDRAARSSRTGWTLQRAAEIALLAQTRPKLVQGFGAPRPQAPRLQAAFCLDVRSEAFRRGLEAQGDDIQTLGIAGFFGLPIEYVPLAADHASPQLPGALAPKYRVTDTGVEPSLEATRRARLGAAYAWKAFKSSSLSSFAYVDAVGLFYARSMFRDAFRGERHRMTHRDHPGLTADEDRVRVPRLTTRIDGTPLTADERCDIAAALLRTMALTQNFARLVLLVGHGSETKNNAYAAGIDCGACGGHPGDVNARAMAALLNDGPIRAGLAERGIEIPSTTFFVAALHNTTTDEVTLFDLGAVTRTHQVDLDIARDLLDRAGAAARRLRGLLVLLGRRSLRRMLRHPRSEQLARALRVDARAVLRVERRCLRGAVDVGSRGHLRPRRTDLRVHDRSRDSALVQDGHGRLADPQRGKQRRQVVVVGLRERRDGRPQRLRVVGRECAQRVLDPVAELREHVRRHVLRLLRAEEHADALRADQPHRLDDRVEEGLRRTVEEQVRLVEEEDELRLVAVTDLGELLEQLGEHPHQRRREQGRLVLDRRELDAGDDSAPVLGVLHQIGDLHLRLPEELGAAAVLELDQLAEQHADRRRRHAADPGQLCLAVLGAEEREQGAQVGEVEKRQSLLVRVAKQQGQALLLRLVRLEHLAEQQRAEVGDRRPHRNPWADAADREVVHRERLRLERLPELLPAVGGDPARAARLGEPGQIALHVGGEDRDAGVGELLGDSLQPLGLPRSRRAGDQAVAVHHLDRDLDEGLGDDLAVQDAAAELEGRSLNLVGAGDRRAEV
jgi:hypothetical protein